MDRCFCSNGLTDFRSGGLVLALHDMEAVAIAELRCLPTGENDELDSCGKPFRVFPIRQRLPLVTSHDPEQSGGGELIRHGFSGLIGIGWPGLEKFKIIDDGPGEFCRGEAEHFTAILAAGGIGVGFVWGNPAG